MSSKWRTTMIQNTSVCTLLALVHHGCKMRYSNGRGQKKDERIYWLILCVAMGYASKWLPLPLLLCVNVTSMWMVHLKRRRLAMVLRFSRAQRTLKHLKHINNMENYMYKYSTNRCHFVQYYGMYGVQESESLCVNPYFAAKWNVERD